MNNYSKAISYLEKKLSMGIWKPGDRLSGIKDLTHDAGVSDYSMRRAIKVLAQKGHLSVEPSSGIRVLPCKENVSSFSGKREQKWEKVQANIANDLLSRKLNAFHPLPSIQELVHRYGVSYPILKKALNSLEKKGLLTSYKRSYKSNLFSVSGSVTKILVLVPVLPDNIDKAAVGLFQKGYYLSERGAAFLYKLEQLCNTQNLSADIWGYFFKENATTYLDPEFTPYQSTDQFKRYFGVCLIKALPYSADFSLMLSSLSDLLIPISILEETGDFFGPIPKTKNKNIRIFPIGATSLASQQIGNYLLDLGHRQIAFISAWQKATWSQSRHQGLCNACALVKNSKVHLFADNRFSAGEIHLENIKLEESIERVPSIEEIIKTYTLFSPEQAESIALRAKRTFQSSIYWHRLEIFLQPLFDQAISNEKITAWVCADDRMSFLALRFLRKNGVAVPEKISVVGFEGAPESYDEGLTTFNFDLPGITQAMIAFICNPGFFPVKNGIVLEKNGYLVIRKTTGPVPEN